MDALGPWLICLHVVANLVWIGSVTAAGFLLGRAPDISRWIFVKITNPAWIAAFLFGGAKLSTDLPFYMHAHWMHGKLTVALVAIGLTHAIGARARRLAEAQGKGDAAGSVASHDPSRRQIDKVGANLTVALLACAFLAVAFVTALRIKMS